ncbi:MAG: hypothetical protein JXA54_17435 [Candidatus Heimdallarchaeota archaeon]|nr:hypothetical protein [Candidatus Heimdallarchaeota archaeon]
MKGGEIPYQYQGKTNIKASELESFLQENSTLVLDDVSVLRAKAGGMKDDVKIQFNILKEELGSSRVVKGVRGALRHSIMELLHQKGIAYCSPTMKEQFQGNNESTLLPNEHLLGKCGNDPCPIRQLFGMLGETSPIKVWSDVLVQTDKSSDKITSQKGMSFAHISTENHHASRRDGKVIQDFSEQYFSGMFQFYVEFSDNLPQWLLGMLIEGILSMNHLGRGSNTGYGRLEIKELTFEHVIFERKLGVEKNGKVAIIEEEQTELKNQFIQECLDAWKNHH